MTDPAGCGAPGPPGQPEVAGCRRVVGRGGARGDQPFGARPGRQRPRRWETLTAGDGPEGVTQWRVQLFCWDQLPRWGPDGAARWHVATALAALLDALGMERYAKIASSETTRQILTAADQGTERGRGLARKAAQRSGIDPPGTELLTWGAVMEPAEAAALEAVADRLEIRSPQATSCPVAGAGATSRPRSRSGLLTTPQPVLGGQLAPTKRILDERLSRWAPRAEVHDPAPGCSTPLEHRLRGRRRPRHGRSRPRPAAPAGLAAHGDRGRPRR